MLLGGLDGLYESTDRGDTVTNVMQDGMARPVALAFGGWEGGEGKPDIAYVGTASGQVLVRASIAGGFVASPAYPGAPRDTNGDGVPDTDGTPVRDIVLHPDDWRTAFAIDSDSVYMTRDAGATWTDISGTLSVGLRDFRTVAFSSLGVDDIVWVGGTPRDPQLGGVFAAMNPSVPQAASGGLVWHPYGDVAPEELEPPLRERLPNVTVTDLYHDRETDTLAAATFGRGAWAKQIASVAVAAGTIRGRVYHDRDGTATFDAAVDEPLVRTVYLDLNENGVLDPGESTVTTSVENEGQYTFSNLPPGRYVVRSESLSGWLSVTPAGGTGEALFSSFITSATEVVVDFAQANPIVIAGTSFLDHNQDGVQDGNEPGVMGSTIYLDLNRNGSGSPTSPAGRRTPPAITSSMNLLPYPPVNTRSANSTVIAGSRRFRMPGITR